MNASKHKQPRFTLFDERSYIENALIWGSYLLSIFIFWRPYNFDKLPGDLGDTRVSAFWMEHWFKFFSGHVAWNDLQVFYPIQNTLSGSDAFLLQGLTHSFFRGIGFNISQSFLLAIFTLHGLGILSSVFIVKNLNWPLFSKCFSVLTFGTMLSFWEARYASHPQLLLFPLLGWIPILIWLYFKSEKHRLIYLSLTLSMIMFLALSTGYGIAFLFFYTLICVTISLTFKIIKLHNFSSLFNFRHLTFAFFINFPLIYLFVKLYLNSNSIISNHSAGETLFYSPTFSRLFSFNKDNLEYRLPIIKTISNKVSLIQTTQSEFGNTFSIITAFVVAISIIIIIRIALLKGISNLTLEEKFFFVLVLSLTISYIIILRDYNGFNLWVISFNHLNFFDSIRVLSRFTIFASLLIPFIISFVFNLIWRSKFQWLAIFLGICVFLSQIMLKNNYFDKSELFVLSNIDHRIKQNCSSFYLTQETKRPELPMYVISGDALAIATRTSVPTINGASSFFPNNYPIELFDSPYTDGNLKTLKKWMKENNIRKTCLITYERNLVNASKSKIITFTQFNPRS